MSLKKKTQKLAAQKERVHRPDPPSYSGIPDFMIRLARAQHVKIFEQLPMPKYRHD